MNVVDSFRKIVSDAKETFLPESGTEEIIPYGIALVRLAETHPEQRAVFQQEFVAASHTAPPELIEFCMHALRWDSLRIYFQQCHSDAVARNDWRAEPFYRHLVDSFEDTWEDAKTFYVSYFGASI